MHVETRRGSEPEPGRGGLGAEILACLRDRRADYIDLLRALASLESPSQDARAQQPVFELLSARLADLGLSVRHHPGQRSGGHLEARPADLAEGAPVQLLLGHCDTVWPRGSLRQMPLRLEGDRLFGPGTYDMKAGLCQGILALEVLRELGLEPGLPPALLINSDEEIGSHESTPAIRRAASRADRVFVLEPSLGPEGRLKTARKGVGRFDVRVQGRAAHAGLNPEEGVSAVLELSHVIQRLFALNDPSRGVTVNVGQVDGGLGANVVAPESSAVVDVRVPTQAEARRLEAAIREIQPVTPGASLHVHGGFGRPPMERDAGVAALWARARALAEGFGLALEEGMAGGGSDGNTTARLAPTLDGLGAVGAGAHALHEQIEISRSLERTALLALLLHEPPLSATGRAESERGLDGDRAAPV